MLKRGWWRLGSSRSQHAEDVEPQPVPAATPVADGRLIWTHLGQEYALRVLNTVYRLSADLTDAEAAERDPDQLSRLYRIDHAITQIRRHAENLHVLTGLRVEDAGRQVTTLADVIRAAASATEFYARVRLGSVADLAVAEFAADDVIRVLTELIDNATRYSRPDTAVTVSAHMTDTGTVLLRVEDHGVGVEPARLEFINRMLAAETLPTLWPETSGHLGLVVVHRLSRAHGLRVGLTARAPSGTTATVLLSAALLCEVPQEAAVPQDRRGHLRVVQPSSASGRARVPGGPALQTSAQQFPGGFGDAMSPHAGELPQRQPSSLRGAAASVSDLEPASAPDERWAQEIGSFAEGISDAHHLASTEGLR